MNVNTIFQGMQILAENMGIIETEKFISLIKAEDFDYTEWQRNYFDRKSREEIDAEMSEYFEVHKNSCPNAVRL